MNVTRFLTALALAALCGCMSLELKQRCRFVDEDGYVATVEYLTADKDHVSTFVSPLNNKELEFKTRLMVRVTLPDDTTFKAWKTMNFLKQGTMYKSDNDEWKFLACGMTCSVWHRVTRRLSDGGTVDDYEQWFGGALNGAPSGK